MAHGKIWVEDEALLALFEGFITPGRNVPKSRKKTDFTQLLLHAWVHQRARSLLVILEKW